jgi:hypothetical protein
MERNLPETARDADMQRHRWSAQGEQLLEMPPCPRRILAVGVKVAAPTVWEILDDAGIDPAPDRASRGWATFLRFHGEANLAIDFFETVTLPAPGTPIRLSTEPPTAGRIRVRHPEDRGQQLRAGRVLAQVHHPGVGLHLGRDVRGDVRRATCHATATCDTTREGRRATT